MGTADEPQKRTATTKRFADACTQPGYSVELRCTGLGKNAPTSLRCSYAPQEFTDIKRMTMDRSKYEKNRRRINLTMSQFTIPLFRRTYDFFKGDFAKVIILGEIAHRNYEYWFARNPDTEIALLDPAESQKIARPSNALSIATACGLPRETVRRKVNEMIACGWLIRDERDYLYVRPGVAPEFDALTIGTVEAFLQTADRLKTLVE